MKMKYASLLLCAVTLVSMSASCARIPPGAVIDVTQFDIIPNDNKDDSESIEFLLKATPPGTTFVFKPGTYDICRSIHAKKLNSLTLIGESGATFKKCDGFGNGNNNDGRGEFLMFLTNSNHLTIENITFYGLTTDTENYQWGEQGILCAGCEHLTIRNNQFYDFGDAAVRITSSSTHPSGKPINAEHILIQGNYFKNVTQVSTTYIWSPYFGGANHIRVLDNTFEALKGGLKLATRQPAYDVLVKNNRFIGNKGTAIESVYYSDVIIENNYFEDLTGFILNAYPLSPKAVVTEFNWGNLAFKNNQIINAKGGLRFQTDRTNELIDSPFVENIHITHNEFINVDMELSTEAKYKDIILLFSVGNKSYLNGQIKHNHYTLNEGVRFVKETEGVSISDNTVEN